jgi:hypothetical protein
MIIEVIVEESVTHVVRLEVPDDFGSENVDFQDEYIFDHAEIFPHDSETSSLEVVTWNKIGR